MRTSNGHQGAGVLLPEVSHRDCATTEEQSEHEHLHGGTSLARQYTPVKEPSASVRIIACPRPFSVDRLDFKAAYGLSLSGIIRECGLDPDPLFARVFIDDVLIPKQYWGRVKPKAGRVVTIRVIPTGGGESGKNVLRVVALIAITVAAVYTGGAAASAYGAVAGAVVTTGISIAGSLAISALIPPPKPRLQDLSGISGNQSGSLSITGSRNQMTPYGPIPRVYGRHRIFPPLGARPFTEIQGNDQYLRLLFVLGYGPLALSDFKIGTTPLEQFVDVQTEIRYGYPDDPPLTLFSQDVFEDALSVALTQAAGFQSRTSQGEAVELSVDVLFPGGLVHFSGTGAPGPRTVQVDVEFRPSGSETWLPLPTSASKANVTTSFAGGNNDLTFEAKAAGSAGNAIAVEFVLAQGFLGRFHTTLVGTAGTVIRIFARQDTAGLTVATAAEVKAALEADPASAALVAVSFPPGEDGSGIVGSGLFYLSGGAEPAGPLVVTDNRPIAIRKGVRWATPLPGEYEVRVRRVTADTNDGLIRDQVVWTTLRTIQSTPPVSQTGLCAIAMRIKATDQLNGIIDQFNCIAQSILADWNGTDWIPQPTSNPASIYRNVFQGSANARPLSDSRMDLTTLQGWHARCAAGRREFNAVIDFRTTVFELARDVAAAGRGSFGLRDGKYSVVEDLPQTVPVQHFTPRNSSGFRGTKTFLDLPHALKVQFRNQAAPDWQQDVRLVYADGYNADGTGGLLPATKFETMDLFGCTDTDQAWREGRYHLAVATLRPEVFELHVDVENLVCTRGDLVRVSHDVPLWGSGRGPRLSAVTTDPQGGVIALTLDDPVVMESGKSYAVRIRKRDGASVVAQVGTSPGEQKVLGLAAPLTAGSVPAVGDLVLFGELNRESVELIVKGIEPEPDLAAKLILIDAAPAVHSADVGMIPPYDPQITLPAILASAVPTPIITSVISDESVLVPQSDGSLQTRIVISLQFTSSTREPASSVQVQYRPTGSQGHWSQLFAPVSGLSPELSVFPVHDGVTYDLMLRGVNAVTGRTSDWVTITAHLVVGQSGLPPDVLTFVREGPRLQWLYPSPPIDFVGFKLRRHVGEQLTWSDAQPLHEGTISQTTYALPVRDVGTVTYLLKAADRRGNESANAATLITTLGFPDIENLLATFDRQAAGFPGTIINAQVIGGNLVSDTLGTFWGSDIVAFWRTNGALFWTTQYKGMTYQTNLLPDAEDVPCTVLLDVGVTAKAIALDYRLAGADLFWSS